MTPAESSQRATYTEYVQADEKSDDRLEYYDGVIVAMASGTPEHAALSAAFIVALGNALEGKPCRVFSADLRVHIDATRSSVHPDLSVVCGEMRTSSIDPLAVTNPVLVVEILSPSTEGHDQGPKASHYRRIESLREYVLVSQHERLVEVYRRNEHERWELFEYREGSTIELASIDARLAVDALYIDPLPTATLR